MKEIKDLICRCDHLMKKDHGNAKYRCEKCKCQEYLGTGWCLVDDEGWYNYESGRVEEGITEIYEERYRGSEKFLNFSNSI